jgi:SAM-dependent methyltransferase
VADALFEHPRLAAIYDALDADRSDLDVYLAIADELGARLVLDVGCGTGTFAVLLAELRRADPARPVRQRHPTRDVEAFGSSGSRPVSLADRLPGQRGWDVTGVDLAAGSLRIGQAKPGAEHVRFQERDEVAADLVAAGYVVDEVRDAPDRPGREFVFLARRPAQPKGIA